MPPSPKPRIVTAFAAAALSVVFSACMLSEPLDWPGARAGAASEPDPGYVRLSLDLERNARQALAKTATADTVFTLDSLAVVLTAPGMAARTYTYPISGRADTGNVALSPLRLELPALRNWTARIYSLSLRANPAGLDTVHIDSVTFAVRPGDTTRVAKIVSPAYSILRARFTSANADSVGYNVLWVRLRVDGVTRDSAAIGGGTTTLNAVHFPSANVGYVAGDSGRFSKTTDAGATWVAHPGGTATRALRSVFFVSDAVGYSIDEDGRLRGSTTGGVAPDAWNPGWTDRVLVPFAPRAMSFTSQDLGFVVGAGGGMSRISSNGNAIHAVNSNTGSDLNAIYFTSAATGYAVGANETILKTTNATTSNAAEIVWSSSAGGWFPQTSGTTGDVRDIRFTSATRGWAIGPDYVRLTTNGGATWEARGGLNVSSPRAFWFTGPADAWTVGDNGQMSQYDGEWYWQPRASGTSQNLRAVRFAGADTGWAVGDNRTVLRTTQGTNKGVWPPNTQWTAYTVPVGATITLRAAAPVTGKIVYIAGDSGRIVKSVNAGNAWSAQTSGTTRALYDLGFAGPSNGWAVGDNGTILHTTNGGGAWNAQASGTTRNLRSIHVLSADTAYAAGDSGLVLKTVNGGSTWYRQGTPTGRNLHRVYFYNSTVGFAVGTDGVILNAVNQGENWSGSGGLKDLYAVQFRNADTGYVAGAQGTLLRTYNAGASWQKLSTGTTATLYTVRFVSRDTGWVTGAGGLILRTVNGGSSWSPQSSGTSTDLRSAFFTTSRRGYVVGGGESLVTTSNGGATWAYQSLATPGAKLFDKLLAWKYLKPGRTHAVLLQAADRASPMRGYEASLDLTIGAGRDSTLLAPMKRCGLVDSLPCTP